MRALMRAARRLGGESGQILAGVILILLVLATIVPLMVMYTEREAKWSVKQDKSTKAFHLAEAGVEKAYRVLSVSTGTWYNLVEHGIQIPGFKFDHKYDDLSEGVYAVNITSGPQELQATVRSVGKVVYGNRTETRSVEVIFQQTTMGDIAIQGLNGVYVNGNNIQVEWGAILSRTEVNINGRTHPQFWSASSILGADTDPAPPNCDIPDCIQWHSFSTDIPPDPGIDLAFYLSSAVATTAGCPGWGTQNPAGSCHYTDPNVTVNSNYTGGSTIYFEGNVATSGKRYIVGNMIVIGNLTTPNGKYGIGNENMRLPTTAWKQYGRDWTNYLKYDNYVNSHAMAFPGLNSAYTSDPSYTYNSDSILLSGFGYVGGDMTLGNGGGNADFYGSIYVVGKANVDANSQARFYYNKAAGGNIRTLKIILARASWKGVLEQWPSGL